MDKAIWDKSYEAEYRGLEKLNTWEVISEQDYEAIKHITGLALPTMAISCIKYDTEGNPI
eukprot:14821930-Ditylum_brightwellii.AAC.1